MTSSPARAAHQRDQKSITVSRRWHVATGRSGYMSGAPAVVIPSRRQQPAAWPITHLRRRAAESAKAAAEAARPRDRGETRAAVDEGARVLPVLSVEVECAVDLHGPGREPVDWSVQVLRRQLHSNAHGDVDGCEVIDVVAIRVER